MVNTAVLMMENEPAIDVRSVTESARGPGIFIWIPGYIDNDGTVIVAPAAAETVAQEAAAVVNPNGDNQNDNQNN